MQRSFRDSAATGLALRDALACTGDLEAFRAGVQGWAVEPGTIVFKSQNGAGFLNQLVKRSDDHTALARVFIDVLTPPTDDDAAIAKVQLLVEHVERLKVGAYPAPGHAPFFLSYFWGLADERWPIAWPRSVAFLEYVTGESLPTAPPDRYRRYLDVQRELDEDNERFEWVASWWDETKPVFLDPVLATAAAFGLEPERCDPDPRRCRQRRARSSVARHIGAAAGRRCVRRRRAQPRCQEAAEDRRTAIARSDLWADWMVNGELGWPRHSAVGQPERSRDRAAARVGA